MLIFVHFVVVSDIWVSFLWEGLNIFPDVWRELSILLWSVIYTIGLRECLNIFPDVWRGLLSILLWSVIYVIGLRECLNIFPDVWRELSILLWSVIYTIGLRECLNIFPDVWRGLLSILLWSVIYVIGLRECLNIFPDVWRELSILLWSVIYTIGLRECLNIFPDVWRGLLSILLWSVIYTIGLRECLNIFPDVWRGLLSILLWSVIYVIGQSLSERVLLLFPRCSAWLHKACPWLQQRQLASSVVHSQPAYIRADGHEVTLHLAPLPLPLSHHQRPPHNRHRHGCLNTKHPSSSLPYQGTTHRELHTIDADVGRCLLAHAFLSFIVPHTWRFRTFFNNLYLTHSYDTLGITYDSCWGKKVPSCPYLRIIIVPLYWRF